MQEKEEKHFLILKNENYMWVGVAVNFQMFANIQAINNCQDEHSQHSTSINMTAEIMFTSGLKIF